MPKVKLTLTLNWNELDVNQVRKYTKKIDDNTPLKNVDSLSEYDLAFDIASGNLPYPMNESMKVLQPDTLVIKAIPVDGFQKTKYLFEYLQDETEAFNAWLQHTHKLWVAKIKEKEPNSQGIPKADAENLHPKFLMFSAKQLMALMTTDEIYEVLYDDFPNANNWKQKLLDRLRPLDGTVGCERDWTRRNAIKQE